MRTRAAVCVAKWIRTLRLILAERGSSKYAASSVEARVIAASVEEAVQRQRGRFLNEFLGMWSKLMAAVVVSLVYRAVEGRSSWTTFPQLVIFCFYYVVCVFMYYRPWD